MSIAIAPEREAVNANFPVVRPPALGESTGKRAVNTSLVMILAIGAVLRLVMWLWIGGLPPSNDDEKDYNKLAKYLVENHEYSLTPGKPTSLRPPLYPFFVAGVYELFGVENWRAVTVIQAILSLLTVCVVYQIGRAAYSERVAVWASAIACFYPSLLAYNSLLLTEILFTLLVCLTLWALIRAVQTNSVPLWVGAGVLLGLAALTRSVLWLFPAVLTVYLLLAGPGTFSGRLKAAVLVCIAFAVTIAPWSIRNSQLQKTFVAVDVMGGRNLMMGNYEFTPLYRAWDATSIQGDQEWYRVLRSKLPEAAGTTQGQLDKLAMKYGVQFMLEHPALTLERADIKFLNFWQLERELISGANEGVFGPMSRAGVVGVALTVTLGYVAAMFSGIFGALVCPPRDLRIHALLLLTVVFVCGMHTLVFGHSRYHLPLMPIVFVYAAAAVVHRRELWNRRRTWQFIAASAACVLLAASWAWETFGVDPQRYFSILS